MKSETCFSREAIENERGKVLKKNVIIDRSWSSAKLFIVQNYTENVNGDVPLMVSGKLPQRKIVPWIIAPWMIAPRIIATRTIASVDNCPLGKLSPRTIAPEENCSPDNCPPPLDDCSRTITLKITAPWQYPPEYCRRGKLSFGWFVAYIIAPRKTAPWNIVPRTNYTQYIFSTRIRNCNTLIDGYFLLF